VADPGKTSPEASSSVEVEQTSGCHIGRSWEGASQRLIRGYGAAAMIRVIDMVWERNIVPLSHSSTVVDIMCQRGKNRGNHSVTDLNIMIDERLYHCTVDGHQLAQLDTDGTTRRWRGPSIVASVGNE